jgi:hypothetical protein
VVSLCSTPNQAWKGQILKSACDDLEPHPDRFELTSQEEDVTE